MDTSVPEGVYEGLYQNLECNLFCFSPCWTQFLKDILRLPAAVGERQTFNMNNDSGTEAIFDPEAKVWRITTADLNLVQHLEIWYKMLSKGDCERVPGDDDV